MKNLLKGLVIFAIILGVIYAFTGIKCINLGDTYTLFGQEWVVGDGGGNRGRCGDKNFNFFNKVYTMDCLKHDTCDRVKGRLKCLGYLIKAMDDFFFAFRCGGK
jgi:hypothetical protein